MMFSFGRDTNIKWKHGVNALPEEEQDGKGRISIVLWGLVTNTVEEKLSPAMVNNRNDFQGRGGGSGGGRGGGGGRGSDRDRRGGYGGDERGGRDDRDRGYGRDDRGGRDDRDRGRDDRDRDRDRGYGRDDRGSRDYRDRDFGRSDRDRDRDRDCMDRNGSGGKQPCRDFKNNNCKYGDTCKHMH